MHSFPISNFIFATPALRAGRRSSMNPLSERYTDISPEAETARRQRLIERIATDGIRPGEAFPRPILEAAEELRRTERKAA